MVCIIDDREDVWNFASNLIRVKPYQFFKGVGDINAPPGGSAAVKEDSTSPGNPVDLTETTEDDAKTEDLNSREDSEGVKMEQEKNDAVFDENEENEAKVTSPETTELQNLGKDVDMPADNSEPVVEKSEDSNNKKALDETVKANRASPKVLENGGNDSTSDENEKEEPTEMQALSESKTNGKQDDDGKASTDQQRSECSINTTCETAEQRTEGGECHAVIAFSCIYS